MSMKMCRGSHWQQTSVLVDDSNGFYFISSARWVSSAGLLWELCPEVNINDTVTSQKLNQMFENESLLFMFIRSTERWITAAVCWNKLVEKQEEEQVKLVSVIFHCNM